VKAPQCSVRLQRWTGRDLRAPRTEAHSPTPATAAAGMSERLTDRRHQRACARWRGDCRASPRAALQTLDDAAAEGLKVLVAGPIIRHRDGMGDFDARLRATMRDQPRRSVLTVGVGLLLGVLVIAVRRRRQGDEVAMPGLKPWPTP
jgi:hypothetical protein